MTNIPHVVILLGLHNGADLIGEQLESFAAQSHSAWSLIVSDDGSSDAGTEVVKAFAASHADHEVKVLQGPCKGFAANFISLINATPEAAEFAALSDQDDVWKPEKLARAVAMLGELDPQTPGLYVARTMICDKKLRTLRPSLLFSRPPDFRNALVQSIGGGNTMVLNRGSIELVQRIAGKTPHIVAHDWWLYQVVTGVGGVVIYDSEPSVLYRQHGSNLIGANDTLRASWTRLRHIWSGRFQNNIDQTVAALEAVSGELTTDARDALEEFSRARRSRSVFGRLWRLRKSGTFRQRWRGTVALYLAAAIGKL